MAEPDRPRSPFAGMADFSATRPVRVLSSDKIEHMLAEHRLYLETEYHEGHRANFASADLTGRDFSGLNLRGVKVDRAVLQRRRFHRCQSAKRESDRRDTAGGALGPGGSFGSASKRGKPRFGQP